MQVKTRVKAGGGHPPAQRDAGTGHAPAARECDGATAGSARRRVEEDGGQLLDGSATEVLLQGVTMQDRERFSRGCAPVQSQRSWGSLPIEDD